MKGNYFLPTMQVSGVLGTIHPELVSSWCKIVAGY